MKTAHAMLPSRDGARRIRDARALLPFLLALPILLGACTREMSLAEPQSLTSPYADDRIIWGVAPLANESGVGIIDELGVTDDLVNEITQVRGLTALPTNRTLEAMRALGIPEVRSPSEARALARALGADAVVVGTITAWDPYDPPKLGMSLALYARTSAMDPADFAQVDTFAFSQAMTDSGIDAGSPDDLPVAAVSRFFDGANHDVVADVRRYANGRHDPRSAIGDEIYLKSMERYTQFVCFRMVESLLTRERTRLALAEAKE